MPGGKRQKTYKASSTNGNITDVLKELWQAAVNLRGSIEPSDYKRYVLPIIFLRFLSLRYERRRDYLKLQIAEPKSEYFGDTIDVQKKIWKTKVLLDKTVEM